MISRASLFRTFNPHPHVAGLVASLLLLAPTAPTARAQIQPEARQLVAAVGAKLGGAQTLRVTARHQVSPGLEIPTAGNGAPVVITVKRPNQFHALQQGRRRPTRELAFDGRMLCLMYPTLGHHALVPLRARSVEDFADAAYTRFGFRPPIAELLATDLPAQLLGGARSARLIPNEPVGWVQCHRIQIGQGDLAGDLWVGADDLLPRRYRLTFLDRPGRPTWDIHLNKWELNAPVDGALFARRPAPGSQAAPMLKSR
jgi:hypothetical protein